MSLVRLLEEEAILSYKCRTVIGRSRTITLSGSGRTAEGRKGLVTEKTNSSFAENV